MISPSYVQCMTRYNAEMNRRLYAAAGRLPDAERRLDRGAFWGSIHATFSHLLWADRRWMSRFADWVAPPQALAESGAAYADFAEMAAARVAVDARLVAWADSLTQDWLRQDMVWVSGAVGGEMTMARALLVMHVFNHQTHHRGQLHAMLTAAGQRTGDTDLFLVLPPLS